MATSNEKQIAAYAMAQYQALLNQRTTPNNVVQSFTREQAFELTKIALKEKLRRGELL